MSSYCEFINIKLIKNWKSEVPKFQMTIRSEVSKYLHCQVDQHFKCQKCQIIQFAKMAKNVYEMSNYKKCWISNVQK